MAKEVDFDWDTNFLSLDIHRGPITPHSGGQKRDLQLGYSPLDGQGVYEPSLQNIVSPPMTPGDAFRIKLNSPPSFGQQNDFYQINNEEMFEPVDQLTAAPKQMFDDSFQFDIDMSPDKHLYQIHEDMDFRQRFNWDDFQQPVNNPLRNFKDPLQRVMYGSRNHPTDTSVNSWSSNGSNASYNFQDWKYTNEEGVICTFPGCGKLFSKQSNLKSHSRIHHTERNFTCPECTASFRRSHDLKRHQRSLHSDIKPYSCSRCSKRFSRMVFNELIKDALKRHTSRETSACYVAGLANRH
jgi:hypothetical protein